MKKILSISLLLVLVFMMCSCEPTVRNIAEEEESLGEGEGYITIYLPRPNSKALTTDIAKDSVEEYAITTTYIGKDTSKVGKTYREVVVPSTEGKATLRVDEGLQRIEVFALGHNVGWDEEWTILGYGSTEVYASHDNPVAITIPLRAYKLEGTWVSSTDTGASGQAYLDILTVNTLLKKLSSFKATFTSGNKEYTVNVTRSRSYSGEYNMDLGKGEGSLYYMVQDSRTGEGPYSNLSQEFYEIEWYGVGKLFGHTLHLGNYDEPFTQTLQIGYPLGSVSASCYWE